MNIQEIVAALRTCANGLCGECPLLDTSCCEDDLLRMAAWELETMAAGMEKLRKGDVPHQSAPLTASPKGSQETGVRWIPVGERLPEEEKAVRVRVRFDDGEEFVAYGVFWQPPEGESRWACWSPEVGELAEVGKVTHWMPVPELPEMKEEDE